MRRAFVALASMGLTCGIFLGCGGGNEPIKTAPGTDTRTAQEKESEDLLQKSQQEYNKKSKK